MRRLARSSPRVLAALLLVGVASACTDEPTRALPVGPTGPIFPADGPRFACEVTTRTGAMTCNPVAPAGSTPPTGVGADVVIGRQDVYIKLTSEGSRYDAATEIFEQVVTVQNLLQAPIGVDSANVVSGVRVFLAADPQVTSGTGTVQVVNADGRAQLLPSSPSPTGQSYWLYNELLEPYQISAPRTWQFQVPSTVSSFSFIAYVSAPKADESAPLLDAVWTGTSSSSWTAPENWSSAAVPGTLSVVAIPNQTLLAGGQLPELDADAEVGALRVGRGSSLALGGRQITVRGNVDAVGEITGGVVRVSGTTARLSGTVPELVVAAEARLQRSLTARGGVTVESGSLDVPSGMQLVVDVP